MSTCPDRSRGGETIGRMELDGAARARSTDAIARVRWQVVVPVRQPATAKSRLGLGPRVAEGIARDTLATIAASELVAELVVVTDDAVWADEVPATVVVEPRIGLGAAVITGLASLAPGPVHGVAVVLGDLPALTVADLDLALTGAAALPRAMVVDGEGSGTTMITALPGVGHDPAFGAGSASSHRQRGYVELVLPATSTIRRDVDTRADMDAAVVIGVGPHTQRALAESAGVP